MNCKEKLLEVRDIHKVYTKEGVPTKALNGITFDVLDGEFLGIMGASGSGKTTLLNCIATVIKPTSGQVLLSGANVSSFDSEKLAEYRGNKIGYLFQDFALLDNLTGRENILLPLSIAYTDIDTVCESNELTADGSSILHSEEDYLLLSYVVDSNIEITKELKDGGWDHLILTNPQWIDRFGDPSKLKPVEYGSLANSMQEFLDVQMPILTADGNVLPDGVGLYQYDGETLLAFPVHVALGAAEPIEAKNPLIILVDKPAQSLKASITRLWRN